MKKENYVRTKGGRIGIIQDWKFVDKEYAKENIMIKFQDELTDSLYHKSNIVKLSPRLIDLIEVGDYVNGLKVLDIYKDINGQIRMKFGENGLVLVYKSNYDNYYLFEEDIKSIVTKECFESMEYKVKE